MEKLVEAKQRSRAVWAAGDYPAVAELIAEMGEDMVARAHVGPGERVLDIACGAGNAAIPAAKTGAEVVGLDLTPELLEGGREKAAEVGVQVEWVEGDAEAMPFEDGSFDIVLSTVGIMFAPNHAVAAREAARVLRPGGRMGLANWRPNGNIGAFFATVAQHMPPPPEGFQPPPLWGVEDHVRELFEGTGVELEFTSAEVDFRLASVEEEVELFADKFGPVLMARRALEPEGKWQALRDDLVSLFGRINTATDGTLRYPGQYLVVRGTKVG